MSATAAKSSPRRQTNGRIASRNRLPERQVAGDRPRLDHRRALPVLAHALVVDQRGVQRDGRRRRRRVGPQPQVGAEHVAVGVAGFHQGDQVAGQPGREGADAIRRPSGGVNRRGAVIQQNEVDIGRVVQFPRAQLAHRQRDEATVQVRAVGVLQADVPGVVRSAQQMPDRQPKGCLGQVGQRAGHGFQWPDSADIRDRGDQGDGPLRLPKRGGDVLALGRGEVWPGRTGSAPAPLRAQLSASRRRVSASRTASSAR